MSNADFLGLRRCRQTRVDTHRTKNSLCWYCSENLPAIFTTVEKHGHHLRVHTGCRSAAADLIAGKWMQEQPDYELETRPIG